MIEEQSPQMKKSVVKLRQLSADERARDIYERREKGRRDQASIIKFEREEGWKAGRKEGRQEEKLILAKKLFAKGMSLEEIAELTNLLPMELKELLQ
jgi:predicted transposase/invertase (TIGR01784 family)